MPANRCKYNLYSGYSTFLNREVQSFPAPRFPPLAFQMNVLYITGKCCIVLSSTVDNLNIVQVLYEIQKQPNY